MAVSNEQKIDFLLKKIGFTKTKTGSVVGNGAITGTPKQPFAEAIPSPLIIANGSLWNESDQIPATPPTSDTTQIKVYLAATSGLRMTADATSSNQRAYIAYSTYGNSSSTRLTNWIDTQFGSGYLIKVFKGDPNSGGVALSAAGSGQNDGWFFDYSAGVLNFNDSSVPSGVTDTNIYIVGYRYIGLTGAPTPTGGGNFTFNDLVVQRNLSVGGLSTFTGTAGFGTHITLNDYSEIRLGEKVSGGNRVGDFIIRHDPSMYGSVYNVIQSTNGNIQIENRDTSGTQRFMYLKSDGVQIRSYTGNESFLTATVNSDVKLYYDNSEKLATTNTGINVTGDGVFSGNVSIGGTLTYEDVTNVDSVGLLTARSGIRVTGGVIEAQAGENKIPSLYSNMGALPSAGSYHGMFAHVHATGRGYFAHAGNWLELVNKEINGVVGTGTENYNVGVITANSFVGGLPITDGADNRVITASSATAIQGEPGLTFDGTTLANLGSGYKEIKINPSTNNSATLRLQNSQANYTISNITGGSFSIADGSDTRLTINSSGTVGVNNDLDVDGHTNLDNVSIAGFTTITRDLDVDGHAEFDAISVSGVTTSKGKFHIRPSSGALSPKISYDDSIAEAFIWVDNVEARFGTSSDFRIYHETPGDLNIIETHNDRQIHIRELDGTNIAKFIPGGSVELYHSGTKHFETSSAGVNIVKDLDVDGHTNLDNVSIAGVTSVASLTSGRVVTVGTGGKLEDSANLTFDGNDLYVRGINIIGGGATSVLGADIVTRNFKATGVSTFVGDAQFDSGIKAGGSTGNNGEYLQSTGSGLTWGSFPSLRTRQTFTASSGQTTFSFAYTVGFLDVYVNGIKLTDSEFTATNGVTTVLSVGCFVGDIVELVAYNTVSAYGGAFGIGNIVEDLSPQLGNDLDLNNKSIIGTGDINITGVITATKFVGDGSGLTGIVASGSGVVIKHDGNTVGTAGTINFSTNLDVSPVSAGIVTITASGGGGGGGVSGINTIGGVVNIANDLDVDGHTNLDNVSIAGVTTFSNNIDVNGNGDISGNLVVGGTINSDDNITITKGIPTLNFVDTNSTDYMIRVNSGNFAIKDITNSNFTKFNIDSVGVTIPENLIVNQQTTLTNLNVSGVATVSNYLTVSDIRSDALTLKNAAGGASYATFSNGGKATLNWNNTKRLETDTNGVNIVGILSATQLAGDGQGITNLPPSGHYAQDEGGAISSDPALVVNYVGAGVSATQSGSVCTVTVPAASGVTPQNLFETIAVPGQSNVVADSATDTLTFAAGSNMTITTNASNDTITFASSGGGGGGGVDVGITTNLSGTFSGGYGTASAINTYAYSSIDRVFEYTVLIERGSDFQTTKVLAKRSGTTVNATQYAVMYSNNLLAQLDVLIVSGEVRLYASPEPGVSGTLTYRIKREVM